ncbi:MAG: R3H domain-containing nucleic acid-binding protein [bacterium]|nr:R3H domain-containing nucleic acid-binding protein [bacterium]
MDTEAIKKTIEEMLSLLDVSYELTVVNDETTGTVCFQIKTGDPQILIGRDGMHLAALSHVIKRISDKATLPAPACAYPHADRPGVALQAGTNRKEQTSFVIDVNNYQGKKTEELKSMASMLAERARYFKSDVEMNPMSPYERMIIHSIFSNVKDIKTESVGEGRGRHVVIKYIAIEE